MAKVNDLSKQIAKALAEYTDDVKTEMLKAQEDLSIEGVQLLKSSSPKDKGDYANSWIRKKTKDGYVLFNKKYQLTHLLEHGHVKRGGGRVSARVHIKPVEERLVEAFESRVEKAIRS